ncbi:hypothetical protein BG261_04130 [Floricoccus tropicus]|uniref:DUF2316 domain-containing protein n=1 Tax=Floricoccus tropicus TaxID=1859473 RepID=A0A1E8GLE8_9LACT|nr:DUF2316 family protein [Floricoccus tropicus]OFI49069.1 hypothetical protein BG261_04130 [Floricoccus tropicus]
MSLTRSQTIETKKEFQDNLTLSGLTVERIAEDLNTTPEIIENTLNLDAIYIEDPWVLKEYLEEKIRENGDVPIEFKALRGDYHQYWFLNSSRIDKMKIG